MHATKINKDLVLLGKFFEKYAGYVWQNDQTRKVRSIYRSFSAYPRNGTRLRIGIYDFSKDPSSFRKNSDQEIKRKYGIPADADACIKISLTDPQKRYGGREDIHQVVLCPKDEFFKEAMQAAELIESRSKKISPGTIAMARRSETLRRLCESL